MKRLILATLLLISYSAFSQVEIQSERIPEKQFLGFQKGKIYMKDGKVLTGEVSYDYVYTSPVKFRADDKAKPEKVKLSDIKAFTVKTDSFVQMNNFKLERPYRYFTDKFMEWEQGFWKVMITGYVNLYKFHFKQENQAIDGYFLTRKKDNYKAIQVVRTYKQQLFMAEMSAYFSDCPEVSSPIVTEQQSFTRIIDIVTKYNACKVEQAKPVE
jgi:hypothetical protein